MSTDESVLADGSGAGRPTPRRGGARRKPKRALEVSGAEGADSGTPPRFWHRDHPVSTPLAGFFTGVVLVVVVLLLLGAILDLVVGYDVSEHPWVFLVALGVLLAANLVLVLAGGTRRFARYMLFGILTTPVVVVGAGALTFYLLVSLDG